MSSEYSHFDPYAHLSIVPNHDGTITRLFQPPRAVADPDPGPDQLAASRDAVLNSRNGTVVRTYRPANIPSEDSNARTSRRLPIIIHFHNSAWALFPGDSLNNHMNCSRMAFELNAVVISVHYRLAPEHKLPAQYDDALEAIMWVKSQADADEGEPWLKDHADFSKCYLYGNSAGANIAFHAALRAVDQDLSPLTIDGCIFYQPLIGGTTRTGSELRNYADPLMPVPTMDVIWQLALPQGVDRDHRYCNLAVDGPHHRKVASLGRCLVIGYGGDVVVDRQQDFVTMLIMAGVRVEAKFDEAGFNGIEIVDPRRAAALLHMIKDFITPSQLTSDDDKLM